MELRRPEADDRGVQPGQVWRGTPHASWLGMDWYVPLLGSLWLFSGALIGYAAARLR